MLPDGRKAVVAYGDSTWAVFLEPFRALGLVLWDLSAAAVAKKCRLRHPSRISALCCAESYLAAGFEDGHVAVLELRKEQWLQAGHSRAVTAMDFGRMAKEVGLGLGLKGLKWTRTCSSPPLKASCRCGEWAKGCSALAAALLSCK